ncbi:hypothetical protein SDC9_144968 [bioreactor metagenome]|uniref:Uncharacterized protein n=1 Tax=bioreactor metagenome TaxID=1076179 RepID=A0A645E8N5_9ZZZZ
MGQAHGIEPHLQKTALVHQLAFDGVLDQMGFLSLFVLLGHLRLVFQSAVVTAQIHPRS